MKAVLSDEDIVSASRKWDLFFILPNLRPPVPSPFKAEHLWLCSGKDPALGLVRSSPANETGQAMLAKYRTWFGKPYVPGVLLVREDAPNAVRSAETLRAFRNVCAAATIPHCTARTMAGNGQWLPLYSDFFVLAAHVASKSGWISKLDGLVGGMDDDVEHFVGQCAGQVDLPDAFSLTVDPVLFRRLLKAWSFYYIAPPKDKELLPLFRSLEVAFQAARFPSDGLSSHNDVGTRIGLWVSAFEVLLHPGGSGRIDKEQVLRALDRVRLSDKGLRRRTYVVRNKGATLHVAFPAFVYDQLYAARNAFMHGNATTWRDLRLRRSRRRPHLLGLAPILYGVALRAFMAPMFGKDDDDELDELFLGLGEIEKALSAARHSPSEHH